MLPRKESSRLDTLELKAMIYRKLGHQRSEKYFDLLKRLLSLKIGKSEFNRFCIQIIGREIIPLHNRFIRAILKNACGAKAPPVFGSSKKVGGNLSVKVANGYQRSCLQSLHGDAFLASPRKGRSPVSRDRKVRDRPSPLGPCGKPQNLAHEEFAFKAQEQQSATELHSLGSRPPVEMASVEEGEEVEQVAGSPGVQSRSPVTAPLGISMNFIGSGKTMSNVSVGRNYHVTTCQNSGELPDTRSLRTHLKQKLETEQIDISVDGVNLLNNALDVYLKRLIEPCLSFSRSRCERSRFTGHQPITGSRYAFQEQHKHRAQQLNNVSLLDFRVAMQLNPEVLGKDWMIQLEKVSLRASEE